MTRHHLSDVRQVPNIQELNHDLLLIIFSYLSVQEIHKFLISNKSIYSYCIKDHIYEMIFKRIMYNNQAMSESLKDIKKEYRKELLKFAKQNPTLYRFKTKQEIMKMEMDLDLFKNNNIGKLVIVGDGAVGKTTFLFRTTRPKENMENWWDPCYWFFENYLFQLEHVTIELCDTAGQEEYDRLRPLTYPNTDIFLLAYSVLRGGSLESIAQKFIHEVRYHVPEAVCVLVACKIDYRAEQQEVIPITFEEGMQFARELNCVSFWETSSKTGEGFEDIGDFLTRLYYIRLVQKIKSKQFIKSKKCILQ